MARRSSTPTVHAEVSASSATVLPGVALPAWAYAPPEPEPEPTPEPPMPEPAVAEMPELEYAGVGATAPMATAPAASTAAAPAMEMPTPVAPVAAMATAAVLASPAPEVHAPVAFPPVAFPPVPFPPVDYSSVPDSDMADTTTTMPALIMPGAPVAEPVADLPALPVMASPQLVPDTSAYEPTSGPAPEWGPPATAPLDEMPAPTELPYDPTYGAIPPTSHHADPDPETDEPRRNLKLPLLIGGVVVAVLLALVAAFITPGFLTSSGSDEESSAVVIPPRTALTLGAAAGYTVVQTPAATASNALAAKQLSALVGAPAVANTYVRAGSKPATVAAGRMRATPTAAAQTTFFHSWASAVGATGRATAAAGPAGAIAVCSTSATGAACAVLKGTTAVTVTIPGGTVADGAIAVALGTKLLGL